MFKIFLIVEKYTQHKIYNLTILSDIKYINIVVQTSPPFISGTLFILQNWKLVITQ